MIFRGYIGFIIGYLNVFPFKRFHQNLIEQTNDLSYLGVQFSKKLSELIFWNRYSKQLSIWIISNSREFKKPQAYVCHDEYNMLFIFESANGTGDFNWSTIII